MGSLTSRPTIKSSPKVVYAPATPAASSPPTSTNPPTTPANTNNPPTGQERAASLLLRDRGRFGTVLTGFRGLLSPLLSANPRKTLLGE